MRLMSEGTFKLQIKTNLGLNRNTKIHVINFKYVQSFTGKRSAEGLTGGPGLTQLTCVLLSTPAVLKRYRLTGLELPASPGVRSDMGGHVTSHLSVIPVITFLLPLHPYQILRL